MYIKMQSPTVWCITVTPGTFKSGFYIHTCLQETRLQATVRSLFPPIMMLRLSLQKTFIQQVCRSQPGVLKVHLKSTCLAPGERQD